MDSRQWTQVRHCLSAPAASWGTNLIHSHPFGADDPLRKDCSSWCSGLCMCHSGSLSPAQMPSEYRALPTPLSQPHNTRNKMALPHPQPLLASLESFPWDFLATLVNSSMTSVVVNEPAPCGCKFLTFTHSFCPPLGHEMSSISWGFT